MSKHRGEPTVPLSRHLHTHTQARLRGSVQVCCFLSGAQLPKQPRASWIQMQSVCTSLPPQSLPPLSFVFSAARAPQPWVLGSKAIFASWGRPWRVATIIIDAPRNITPTTNTHTHSHAHMQHTPAQQAAAHAPQKSNRSMVQCCIRIDQLKHGLNWFHQEGWVRFPPVAADARHMQLLHFLILSFLFVCEQTKGTWQCDATVSQAEQSFTSSQSMYKKKPPLSLTHTHTHTHTHINCLATCRQQLLNGYGKGFHVITARRCSTRDSLLLLSSSGTCRAHATHSNDRKRYYSVRSRRALTPRCHDGRPAR
jgi:hypothetical protein